MAIFDQLTRLLDPSVERDLVRDLEEKFTRAREDRRPVERQWLINVAFYEGNQWIKWDETAKRLVPAKVERWRVLSVVNHIMPTIRTEYAKMMQNRPEVFAQPSSNDWDDEKQAKTTDTIIEHLWYVDGSVGASKKALLWDLITGTGLFKAYWDKGAGKELTQPEMVFTEQGIMVPNPQAGQPVKDKGGEVVHMGELAVVHVSPFQLFLDPFGETLDDKFWLFDVQLRSPEYVMEKYGREIDEQTVSPEEYFEGQLASALGDSNSTRRGILVKEFHGRPTKNFPKGRYVVYANETVLVAGPAPYPKEPIPYAAFTHVPSPGKFWGRSIIQDLIDPQKKLNKTASQAVELINLTAKNQYLIPENSLVRPITSAPGEQVMYTPVIIGGSVFKPEQWPGRNVPDSFWKAMDQAKGDLRDISGVHDVSHAELPSGNRLSGVAIGLLQEQDDTRLSTSVMSYEEALERLTKIKLHIIRQFYDEPRIARIVGEDNTVEVLEFTKEDIPEDVDVKVRAGSGLPTSRVARIQYAFDLWDKEIVRDPRVIVKMLEFGDVEGVFDDINLDIAQAERENEAMMGLATIEDPNFPMPEDFHNQDIHILEHNKKRKTQEYAQAAPETQAVFAAHVEFHKELRTQALLEGQQDQTLAAIAEAASAAGQPVPPEADLSGAPEVLA